MDLKEIKEVLEFYANGWIQKPSKIIKNESGNQIYIEEVWRNTIIQQDHGQKALQLLEKLDD